MILCKVWTMNIHPKWLSLARPGALGGSGAAVRIHRRLTPVPIRLKQAQGRTRPQKQKLWFNAMPSCYSAPSFRIGYFFAVLARPRGGCGRQCV